MNSLRLQDGGALAGLATTLSALVMLFAWGVGHSAANTRGCFGTALVFAIDASGSVDDKEYLLQMGGLSQALRDPEVADAIQGAGGLALAAVVWSDTAVATSTVGWQSVRSAQDVERFARIIESLPRAGGGGTDLGQGVWEALDMLDDPTLCAMRRVIDVSGDGRETHYPRRRHGASIFSARKRARDSGIVINGLAIVDEEKDLEEYYLGTVITGTGAFVIVADAFADFAAAMRSKLLREIRPLNQVRFLMTQPGGESTD